MNQISYPPIFDTPIEYAECEIPFIVIENKDAFRKYILDLILKKGGFQGNSSFSFELKEVSFGDIEIFSDYFNTSLNNKAFINKLISFIDTELCNEKFAEELFKVNQIMQKVLYDSIEQFPYDVDFSDTLNAKEIIKSYNPKFIDGDLENVPEMLIKYMLASRELMGTKLFVLQNLEVFFSRVEVENLYKTFLYEKLNVVVVQSEKIYDGNPYEKCYIVDNDLCVIF